MITKSEIKKNTQGMIDELLQFYKQQGYIKGEAECILAEAVGINRSLLHSLCVGRRKRIDAYTYLNIHQCHQQIMGNT